MKKTFKKIVQYKSLLDLLSQKKTDIDSNRFIELEENNDWVHQLFIIYQAITEMQHHFSSHFVSKRIKSQPSEIHYSVHWKIFKVWCFFPFHHFMFFDVELILLKRTVIACEFISNEMNWHSRKVESPLRKNQLYRFFLRTK